LKVYRGLSRLLERDMKGAAALLIDCIATFSCNEICSYADFIVYAMLSNLLHLPRPQIKTLLLDGPEVLSVAGDIPEVVRPVTSCFVCFSSGVYVHGYYWATERLNRVVTTGSRIHLTFLFLFV